MKRISKEGNYEKFSKDKLKNDEERRKSRKVVESCRRTRTEKRL